jgi:3-isopropylmalate dehydrogenase
MLLAWHGRRAKSDKCANAADAIELAVEAAIAAKEMTRDIGGSLGTRAAGEAVARRVAG